MSQQENPFISICIPAYKREQYLKRLLNSISKQTYTNFEVVITDDSNDAAVSHLVSLYQHKFSVNYHKNSRQLGTPENWNESIRKAKGEWIKLMHDDDWFAGPESLSQFAASIRPEKKFIFSAYENVFEGNETTEVVRASSFSRKMLAANPIALWSANLIGPPSVTLYHKTALEYDKRMKWRVDIDFYIHYLQSGAFVYVDTPLIKVGISQEQVTQSCFLVPEVEIPENFLLLQKTGVRQLKNILAYDSWWRLMRNLDIRSLAQIKAAGFTGDVPAVIKAMISDQQPVSSRMLKLGVVSKLLMVISYLRRTTSTLS